MARLIMFDIDGTFTATNDVDTQCYVQATREHLGAAFDTDWSRYRHVTDSGIVTELLEKHGRSVRELDRVRARFVSLIVDALRAAPNCCKEIPGAAEFLRHLGQMPGVAVGLATGGWADSARAKLRHAGIDAENLSFASADDAEARIDIMKACLDRAGMRVPISETVYVGDGVWDAEASRSLGWQFVGIGEGARAERLHHAGTRDVFADFRYPERVLTALGVGSPP